MPQIFKFPYEDPIVKCHFEGFRRCPLLSWVPYLTGSEPKIWLSVKSSQNQIKNVAIEHIHPDGSRGKPEFEISSSCEQFIQLRQITEAGFHTYCLTIILYDGTRYRENLLQTGQVFYWDSVIRRCVAVGGGAFVIFLLEEWIRHLFV